MCEAYELIQDNYVDDLDPSLLAEAASLGLREFAGSSTDEPMVCPLPTEEFEQACEVAASLDLPSAEAAEAIVSGLAIFALDPNSAYLDQEALDLLEEEQEGEIAGIGALVSTMNDAPGEEDVQCGIVSATCHIVIASTIEGSPAEAAGIRADDRLIAVDGRSVEGQTIDEVAATVRGPAGSEVTITLERGNETFDVTITRAEILIPSIETARFGDDGYIRLFDFSGTADEQFRSAVVQLLGEGVDDLVVDLRNNPGGLLTTAIDVTSAFLPSGAVVVTEGPDETTTYPVDGATVVPENVDVVFVVNRASASASEVVSAVLQERGRATVVGENTYGKNTVQQRFDLSNGGALKLTIARWLTPEGLDFGGTGVSPDVEMTLASSLDTEQLVAMVVGVS